MALNFMAVIGKLYSGSGLEDLLIESGIYNECTVTKVLHGKSYNRGVRTWKLVFEAMMRLKLRSFCEWAQDGNLDEISESDLIERVEQVQQCFVDSDTDQADALSGTGILGNAVDLLEDKLVAFSSFGRRVSATFAFWDDLLDMIQLLLNFIRAERDAMWMLHLATVAEMIPYFFIADHTNYARWASVYLADMNLLPTNIQEEFMKGNHTVGRSTQPFSQVWSDMALEQSINCDSKSKGGVIEFTKKPGALDRWFINAHERAAVKNQMLKMLDIHEEDAKHKEMGKARKERDEEDVNRVLNCVTEIGKSPFLTNESTNDRILNILTGTVAPESVSRELLQAKSNGINAMDEFVSNRLVDDKVPFFDAIKKTQLKTFSTLTKAAKTLSKSGEKMNITADRQLFGRIMVVAKTREVDLKELFAHELSPVPLSLAKPDGTLNKTAKQTLLAELEKASNASFSKMPEANADIAWIIDGMAFVRMIKCTSAKTFMALSELLFQQIFKIFDNKLVRRIDVVFDRYDGTLSIKSPEHVRRNPTIGPEVKIANNNTPLPKQWEKYLSNPKNKSDLCNFLSETWIAMASKRLHAGQEFVTSGGFNNMLDCKVASYETVADLRELQSNHEEADTRLLLHASHAARKMDKIVIWSPDTDVAVLMVYFSSSIKSELWLKTGVKDRARYINTSTIAQEMGSTLTSLILPVHALTGCDSVSSFSGKGKVKPWRMVVEEPVTHSGLDSLGDNSELTPRLTDAIEAFVVALYDNKSDADINTLRYHLFCQKHARNDALPPTKDSSIQHSKRAHFQAHLWKNALKPLLGDCSPVGNGWVEDNATLNPLFMTAEVHYLP